MKTSKTLSSIIAINSINALLLMGLFLLLFLPSIIEIADSLFPSIINEALLSASIPICYAAFFIYLTGLGYIIGHWVNSRTTSELKKQWLKPWLYSLPSILPLVIVAFISLLNCGFLNSSTSYWALITEIGVIAWQLLISALSAWVFTRQKSQKTA